MPNISSQQENLHRKFKQYGALHLEYRRKCIGLLPEIFKEKIYIKKGFDSIFEYAGKLAGLSHEQTKRVLSLSDRFTDKPVLKACLENGEVSVNKLAKIASVVTIENEDFWASQAKILPTRALETLVRDEHHMAEKIPDESVREMTRSSELESRQESIFGKGDGSQWSNNFKNNNGLPESKNSNNFVHVNKILELDLNSEVIDQLLQLKQKGIDINQILLDLLKKREVTIAEEKEKIVAAMVGEHESQKMQISKKIDGAKKHTADQSATQNKKSSKSSRYIPVKVKRIITQEHGTQCSIPTCIKPSRHVHHAQRFSLIQHAAPQFSHDPRYLAPLCKEHHTIAHSIDVRYQEVKNALP